jgi:hypothetical protein
MIENSMCRNHTCRSNGSQPCDPGREKKKKERIRGNGEVDPMVSSILF